MSSDGQNRELPALKSGRVHEISGPSGALFAIFMAGDGDIMVCAPPRWLESLHPEGVGKFRDPDRFIHVSCPLDGDALWAAETALRSGSVKTVMIVTGKTPGLTNFRRLQLAAQAGEALGLLIVNRPALSSAAETRWHCLPKPAESKDLAEENKNDSTPIFASLYKNKKGTVGSWIVNVRGEKGSVRLDAAPAGEPVWPDRAAGG